MKLDKEELLKIAKNARLQLSEAEVEEFLPQVSEILDVFAKLDEVDTTDVKPSFHPIPVENVFREDEVTECLSKSEVFKGVKNKEEDYFKGPKAV
jgi:aspartyl-tRNA(Asn)/glutamyl-tRNA(Gln) amidotransferase subunit C